MQRAPHAVCSACPHGRAAPPWSKIDVVAVKPERLAGPHPVMAISPISVSMRRCAQRRPELARRLPSTQRSRSSRVDVRCESRRRRAGQQILQMGSRWPGRSSPSNARTRAPPRAAAASRCGLARSAGSFAHARASSVVIRSARPPARGSTTNSSSTAAAPAASRIRGDGGAADSPRTLHASGLMPHPYRGAGHGCASARSADAVDLGVERGRPRARGGAAPAPISASDAPRLEHLGRGRGPQAVRPDARQPGSVARGPHDQRDRRAIQLDPWVGSDPHGTAPGDAHRGRSAKIGHERLTDIDGHRQQVLAAALPAHKDLRRARQSISSSVIAATSPARNPSRAINNRIAIVAAADAACADHNLPAASLTATGSRPTWKRAVAQISDRAGPPTRSGVSITPGQVQVAQQRTQALRTTGSRARGRSAFGHSRDQERGHVRRRQPLPGTARPPSRDPQGTRRADRLIPLRRSSAVHRAAARPPDNGW